MKKYTIELSLIDLSFSPYGELVMELQGDLNWFIVDYGLYRALRRGSKKIHRV